MPLRDAQSSLATLTRERQSTTTERAETWTDAVSASSPPTSLAPDGEVLLGSRIRASVHESAALSAWAVRVWNDPS